MSEFIFYVFLGYAGAFGWLGSFPSAYLCSYGSRGMEFPPFGLRPRAFESSATSLSFLWLADFFWSLLSGGGFSGPLTLLCAVVLAL